MANKKFFKITEETFDTYSDDEIIDKLEDKNKEMINEHLDSEKSKLLCYMEDCESPIERMFAVAMNQVLIERIYQQQSHGLDIQMTNQWELKAGGKNYRVDFTLQNLARQKPYSVIVECDGHDFHEKTKEQVARDKERERDLIKTGHTVIRFSGSEIYKSPYKCANEVFDLFLSNCSMKVSR